MLFELPQRIKFQFDKIMELCTFRQSCLNGEISVPHDVNITYGQIIFELNGFLNQCLCYQPFVSEPKHKMFDLYSALVLCDYFLDNNDIKYESLLCHLISKKIKANANIGKLTRTVLKWYCGEYCLDLVDYKNELITRLAKYVKNQRNLETDIFCDHDTFSRSLCLTKCLLFTGLSVQFENNPIIRQGLKHLKTHKYI